MDDSQAQNILDLSKNQVESEIKWMQGIVTMASGFLGLLIALHTTPSKDMETHYLYSSILCIIGLGILTGVIYLFSSPNTQERLRKKYLYKVLQSQGKGNVDSFVSPYKIFSLMRKISCACFFVSVPLLIYYAILVDAP